MLFWPIGAIICWGISGKIFLKMKVNKIETNGAHQTSSFIFLVGFCIIFFVLSILQLRCKLLCFIILGNNFKINKTSFAMFILGLLCFFGYQCVAVLYIRAGTSVSFMSLSAVFLAMNAFIILLMVFIVYGDKSATIVDVITKYRK